jgi:hypothetical protein
MQAIPAEPGNQTSPNSTSFDTSRFTGNQTHPFIRTFFRALGVPRVPLDAEPMSRLIPVRLRSRLRSRCFAIMVMRTLRAGSASDP